VALAALPVRLAAQESAVERTVTSVTFRGNHALDAATLSAAIATSASSWTYSWPVLKHLGLGTRRVFDELEFRRDVVRLQILYRQHGYFDARVDTSVARTPTSVAVTFLLEEGPPVLVDSIAVRGLDSILDARRLARRLPLAEGKPFDRIAFAAAADTIALAVQNLGYPFVGVFRNYGVERETRLANVEYAVVPGPRARFGAITIAGAAAVSPGTIRRSLAVRSGDWFSQDALYDSQRSLYQTDLFRYVSVGIAPDSGGASGADSVVPLLVQVTEGPRSRFRAGVGYGTIDCFRSQATLSEANFLGGGRRLDLAGKLSKLGVGAPTDFGMVSSLCSALSGDPFSERVNYLASATFTQPAFLHRRNTLTFTAFAERRSEYKAFERRGIGGSLALAYGLTRASLLTLSYRLNYGRTTADQAVFCIYFDRCEPSAVAQLSEPRRAAALSLSLVRTTANSPLEPTAGSVLLLEGSHASPLVGSEPLISYNKVVAEGTWYAALSRGWVVALRLRGGAIRPGLAFVADSSIRFVPPEERFYAGGPASVRGFGRNEMGPLVYVADSMVWDPVAADSVPAGVRTSPIGSYAIALANLELRFPSPVWGSRLRLAAFVDAGELWDQTAGGLMPAGLRVTPGLGVRFGTPLGPVRVDVAYNRYPRQTGPLYTVKPPSGKPPGPLYLRQESYGGPQRGTSFFRRLQFQFSVGEAY
jgi:outer membrane protein assembly factor BamA